MHQDATFALAVFQDLAGEVWPVPPLRLEADCTGGHVGSAVCGVHGLVGGEVDVEAVAPFLMGLEHLSPDGIGGLARGGGFGVAYSVVC